MTKQIDLILERQYTKFATIGNLTDVKTNYLICHTLELPWKDNKPKISCIPEGLYILRFEESLRFKRKMIRVNKVPARSGILFHAGNNVADSQGCILPVSYLKQSGVNYIGYDSRLAMNKLQTHLFLNYNLDKNMAVTLLIKSDSVLSN